MTEPGLSSNEGERMNESERREAAVDFLREHVRESLHVAIVSASNFRGASETERERAADMVSDIVISSLQSGDFSRIESAARAYEHNGTSAREADTFHTAEQIAEKVLGYWGPGFVEKYKALTQGIPEQRRLMVINEQGFSDTDTTVTLTPGYEDGKFVVAGIGETMDVVDSRGHEIRNYNGIPVDVQVLADFEVKVGGGYPHYSSTVKGSSETSEHHIF